MKKGLSVLMLTQDNEETVGASIASVVGIAGEIVVVDGFSRDGTLPAIRRICGKDGRTELTVVSREYREIGEQRKIGLEKTTREWVLIIDSDEVVSPALSREIAEITEGKSKKDADAYIIPFRNHYMGKLLRHGGEDYEMMRLFRRDRLKVEPSVIHNRFSLIGGSVARLSGHIDHYSYRRLVPMYRKFTYYAVEEARSKLRKGERSTPSKILLYPLHMFHARFIKDRGYRDGLFRLPLDLGFAYMEFLTYACLALMQLRRNKR